MRGQFSLLPPNSRADMRQFTKGTTALRAASRGKGRPVLVISRDLSSVVVSGVVVGHDECLEFVADVVDGGDEVVVVVDPGPGVVEVNLDLIVSA